MTTRSAKPIDTFLNPAPQRYYQMPMEIPDSTCLCSKTGQPDFAVLSFGTIPDKLYVELADFPASSNTRG